MREAIGGTWLFNLVIFFVLLFAGYMCLSINYSKAFSVKDKIITEIERNGGIKSLTNSDKKDETMNNIADYLVKMGYRNKGNCDGYSYGCDRNGTCIDLSGNSRGQYSFCIEEVTEENVFKNPAYVKGEYIFVTYYKVKVFYHLDLPVIRQMFNFNVKGDTKILYNIENAK